MALLTALMPVHPGEVVALIGSGGKTTLLWRLAQEHRKNQTLVSTSTHLFQPDPIQYDVFLDQPPQQPYIPAPGITLAGTPIPEKNMIGSFAPTDLSALLPCFPFSFLECDGSRMRPLKGWAKHEPVIPIQTTLTICVIPVWPLGLPVADERIHRLPLFSNLTGAKAGETLTPGHLAMAIQGESGLLAQSNTKKILFFSQVEDIKSMDKVRQVVDLLSHKTIASLAKIVAGSALNNQGEML